MGSLQLMPPGSLRHIFNTLANKAVFTPLLNFVRIPLLPFRCEGCGEKGVNNTIQITMLNNWGDGVASY